MTKPSVRVLGHAATDASHCFIRYPRVWNWVNGQAAVTVTAAAN